MALKDVQINEVLYHANGKRVVPCKAHQIVVSLSAEDRETLLDWFCNRNLSARQVCFGLEQDGHSIGMTVMTQHLNGTCTCRMLPSAIDENDPIFGLRGDPDAAR